MQLDRSDYAIKLMTAQNLVKSDPYLDNVKKVLNVADSAFL